MSAASCISDGQDKRVCSACFEAETRVSPATGIHTPDDTGVCTGCHAVFWTEGLVFTPTGSGSYAVTDYTGTSAKVLIPNTYRGLPVVAIRAEAFSYCEHLEELHLSATLESLDVSAFRGCTSLAAISVDPENTVYRVVDHCLIEIQSQTLVLGCQSSIIPDDGSVLSIGAWAFAYADGLTSFSIPASVQAIGPYAFAYCHGLEDIALVTGLESVGEYAFYDCSALEVITIPDSVSALGAYAFSDCASLHTAIMPSDLDIVCEGLFQNCGALSTVELPSSARRIEGYAFYGCSSLTEISLPEGITSIGEYAFRNCSNLTGLAIPSNVTVIGRYAFSGCTRFENATFGQTDGWLVGSTPLDSAVLSDSTTAAAYLKTTYYNLEWQRA